MKPRTGQLLLLLLLTLTLPALSQTIKRPTYRVIVHLKSGARIRGVPYEVKDEGLEFSPFERIRYDHMDVWRGTVTLAEVKYIVVKRTDKRRPVRNGAIIGGALGAYVAIRGYKRDPFRSPVLGGITVAATIGAIGIAGGVVGSLIGSTSRLTLRPGNRENPAESLESQLRPFTEVYLDTLNWKGQ